MEGARTPLSKGSILGSRRMGGAVRRKLDRLAHSLSGGRQIGAKRRAGFTIPALLQDACSRELELPGRTFLCLTRPDAILLLRMRGLEAPLLGSLLAELRVLPFLQAVDRATLLEAPVRQRGGGEPTPRRGESHAHRRDDPCG